MSLFAHVWPGNIADILVGILAVRRRKGRQDVILLQKDSFLPLVERYLASIPACQKPPVLRSQDVTPLPNTFPTEVVVEEVK